MEQIEERAAEQLIAGMQSETRDYRLWLRLNERFGQKEENNPFAVAMIAGFFFAVGFTLGVVVCQ